MKDNGTIRAESQAADGPIFLCLEHSLRLVADAVQLHEVVKGSEGEQVHIVCPECGGDFGAHELLYLYAILFCVFGLHSNLIQKQGVVCMCRVRDAM